MHAHRRLRLSPTQIIKTTTPATKTIQINWYVWNCASLCFVIQFQLLLPHTQNITQGLDLSSVCVWYLHVCEFEFYLYSCRTQQLPATDIKPNFHYDLLRKEFAFRWPFECLLTGQSVHTEWTVYNRVVQLNSFTAIKDSFCDV